MLIYLYEPIINTDTLNWHDYDGYTKITAPSLNVNSMDEDESKRIIVHKTLSQSCSENKAKLKIASSMKLYRRTIPQRWTYYVQQR